jgi:superoxide dismutase, Cu-Zn family
MKLRNTLLLSAAVVFVGQVLPAQAQGRVRDERGRFVSEERAVCTLIPVGRSGVSGIIFFSQRGDRVHIAGKIRGLTPGKHGFHVHEFGDISDEAKGESAGGHFNPHHEHHGAPDARTRHVGDLGNVIANGEGVAIIEESDSLIRLEGPDSIIGRSVVVHEKPDVFIQPTGGAGGRVAVGVIGWANPKSR